MGSPSRMSLLCSELRQQACPASIDHSPTSHIFSCEHSLECWNTQPGNYCLISPHQVDETHGFYLDALANLGTSLIKDRAAPTASPPRGIGSQWQACKAVEGVLCARQRWAAATSGLATASTQGANSQAGGMDAALQAALQEKEELLQLTRDMETMMQESSHAHEEMVTALEEDKRSLEAVVTMLEVKQQGVEDALEKAAFGGVDAVERVSEEMMQDRALADEARANAAEEYAKLHAELGVETRRSTKLRRMVEESRELNDKIAEVAMGLESAIAQHLEVLGDVEEPLHIPVAVLSPPPRIEGDDEEDEPAWKTRRAAQIDVSSLAAGLRVTEKAAIASRTKGSAGTSMSTAANDAELSVEALVGLSHDDAEKKFRTIEETTTLFTEHIAVLQERNVDIQEQVLEMKRLYSQAVDNSTKSTFTAQQSEMNAMLMQNEVRILEEELSNCKARHAAEVEELMAEGAGSGEVEHLSQALQAMKAKSDNMKEQCAKVARMAEESTLNLVHEVARRLRDGEDSDEDDRAEDLGEALEDMAMLLANARADASANEAAAATARDMVVEANMVVAEARDMVVAEATAAQSWKEQAQQANVALKEMERDCNETRSRLEEYEENEAAEGDLASEWEKEAIQARVELTACRARLKALQEAGDATEKNLIMLERSNARYESAMAAEEEAHRTTSARVVELEETVESLSIQLREVLDGSNTQLDQDRLLKQQLATAAQLEERLRMELKDLQKTVESQNDSASALQQELESVAMHGGELTEELSVVEEREDILREELHAVVKRAETLEGQTEVSRQECVHTQAQLKAASENAMQLSTEVERAALMCEQRVREALQTAAKQLAATNQQGEAHNDELKASRQETVAIKGELNLLAACKDELEAVVIATVATCELRVREVLEKQGIQQTAHWEALAAGKQREEAMLKDIDAAKVQEQLLEQELENLTELEGMARKELEVALTQGLALRDECSSNHKVVSATLVASTRQVAELEEEVRAGKAREAQLSEQVHDLEEQVQDLEGTAEGLVAQLQGASLLLLCFVTFP